MNTTQLRKILSRDPITKKYFLDVFASDHLPESIEQFPSCFIANVDSSAEPGSHWVAFYLSSKDKMEFFDSFGNEPAFYEGPIRNFTIQFSHVNYNPLTLQTDMTAVCGQYCIYYLYSRCRGSSLKTFLSHFSVKHMCNDQRVYTFVSKRFRVHANFYQ